MLGSCSLALSLIVPAVDAGWHRDVDGNVEIVIRLDQLSLDRLSAGKPLISELPHGISGVTRYRLVSADHEHLALRPLSDPVDSPRRERTDHDSAQTTPHNEPTAPASDASERTTNKPNAQPPTDDSNRLRAHLQAELPASGAIAGPQLVGPEATPIHSRPVETNVPPTTELPETTIPAGDPPSPEPNISEAAPDAEPEFPDLRFPDSDTTDSSPSEESPPSNLPPAPLPLDESTTDQPADSTTANAPPEESRTDDAHPAADARTSDVVGGRYAAPSTGRYPRPETPEPRFGTPRYPAKPPSDSPAQPIGASARAPDEPSSRPPFESPVSDSSDGVAADDRREPADSSPSPDATPDDDQSKQAQSEPPASLSLADRLSQSWSVLAIGLFASLGGNVFLGWVTMDQRQRYRSLLDRITGQHRDSYDDEYRGSADRSSRGDASAHYDDWDDEDAYDYVDDDDGDFDEDESYLEDGVDSEDESRFPD